METSNLSNSWPGLGPVLHFHRSPTNPCEVLAFSKWRMRPNARLRHSLLDLARRWQSGGNADTVDFAIFRLQQINRRLVQSDRFNEVVHCISAVTILLESVEEFGTNHGPHACNFCAERCRRKTKIRYSTTAASISDRLWDLYDKDSTSLGGIEEYGHGNENDGRFRQSLHGRNRDKSRTKPKVWKRYIDEVFSPWDVSRKIIDLFIEQANTSFHPTINWVYSCDRGERNHILRR